MAGPFGVVDEGFNVKTTDDILSSIQQRQLQEISPSLDVQPTALIGQNNGIFADELGEAWAAIGAVYNGMDPDEAAGDQLDNVCLISGTERSAADATVVAVSVNVNASFHADPGTMFASIAGNAAAVFTNETAVDNAGGVPADVPSTFVAVSTGPTQCLAGTLTVKAQPLAGWNTITNPTDGIPGHNIETDPQLRQKRNQELSAAGSTTADAIRADVLETLITPFTTTDTINCTVLHNDTDYTDANNVPPHSVEVIAYQPGNTSVGPGNDDQKLADLILASKAAGIGTYGLASKLSTDDQGIQTLIKYTRPTPLILYIAITVVVNKNFPSDGAAQVANALLAYGQVEYAPGGTVFLKALAGSVFTDPLDPAKGVPGVDDYTSFTCDTNPVPVGTTNVPVSVRQIASFDSARIFVTVVNE
jgi:hypothetical protein